MRTPKYYMLTPEERSSIISKIFEISLGIVPRQTDIAVCVLMSDREARGQQGINNLIEVTCDYIHDHWMGEPEEPSVSEMRNIIKPIIKKWHETINAREQSC